VKIDGSRRYTVQLYPVPAKSRLFVSGIIHYNRIEVTDITGKLVISRENRADLIELDLAHLVPGVYTIRLTGKTDMQSLQFMKQ
jgi:hypothetical protein